MDTDFRNGTDSVGGVMDEVTKGVSYAVNHIADNFKDNEILNVPIETQKDIIFLFCELASTRLYDMAHAEGFEYEWYENMVTKFESELRKLVKVYMDLEYDGQ